MTLAELQTKIKASEDEITRLEQEALSHEQAAREARVARDGLKAGLRELRQQAHNLATLVATEASAKSAADSEKRISAMEEEIKAELERVRNLRKSLEEQAKPAD